MLPLPVSLENTTVRGIAVEAVCSGERSKSDLFMIVLFSRRCTFFLVMSAHWSALSYIFPAVFLCQDLFHRAFEHPEIKTIIFHATFPPVIYLQTRKTQPSCRGDKSSLHPYTAWQSCGRIRLAYIISARERSAFADATAITSFPPTWSSRTASAVWLPWVS